MKKLNVLWCCGLKLCLHAQGIENQHSKIMEHQVYKISGKKTLLYINKNADILQNKMQNSQELVKIKWISNNLCA